jgi:hypothetical protein
MSITLNVKNDAKRPLMGVSFSRRLAALALVLLALGAGASADNKPQWTFRVPDSATITSDTSNLVYAGTDSLGDVFLIIEHFTELSNYPDLTYIPAGLQFFLLKPNGKLIAGGEATNATMCPVLLTPKRLLCIMDGTQLTEFKVSGTGFTATPVAFDGLNEVPFSSSQPQASSAYTTSGIGYPYMGLPGYAFANPAGNRLIDKGRLYTVERNNAFGIVTLVDRYVVGTVKP